MLSPPKRAAAHGADGGVSSYAAAGRGWRAAYEEPESFETQGSLELEASDAWDPRDGGDAIIQRDEARPYAVRSLGVAHDEARSNGGASALRIGADGERSRAARLAALLHDLRADVQPGGAPELSTARLATGLPAVDRLLGGGFPRGRLAEIAGPISSGRTSLALALLAETTRRGALASVIDAADAFDPSSADAAGIDLARVLWARPPGIAEALRCAEHVLDAGGFDLVIIDLAFAAARERPCVPDSAWPRLRKSAASADAGLVLLTHGRLAGASADLALELGVASARFAAQPSWLESLESRIQLVRNRAGPTERTALVRFAPFAA
jgi:hypothetical protein